MAPRESLDSLMRKARDKRRGPGDGMHIKEYIKVELKSKAKGGESK